MPEGDAVDQISEMFDTLKGKIDRMSNNIENIAGSMVTLTDQINEAMNHVSGNLENLIDVFEKTFQFKELTTSNKTIEKIADKMKDKFDLEEFNKNLGELNNLIMTLKKLKEEPNED